MPGYNRFSETNIEGSITYDSSLKNPVDRNYPLSFIEWIKYNAVDFTNINDVLSKYQNYVLEWHITSNNTPKDNELAIVDLYKNLLNEIVLNYTSVEERRFLRNIDLTNKKDLIVAVPFFAKKIRDICLYFSTIRDNVKYAVIEANLKGSNEGIEKIIYNLVSKVLETQDLTDVVRSLNLSVSGVRNNLVVEIEELFDNYPNYFDLGNLPASAYGDSQNSDRYNNFELFNINDDPYINLNLNSAIVNAITSYPFFTVELGTNNFSITPFVSATQLNLLKDRDFINLINNETASNLSLQLNKFYNSKYSGTDYYYLSTNNSIYNPVTGQLYKADYEFANFLNKNSASVAYIQSTEYLKTPKQQGLFFKPDKTGLLIFNNYEFVPEINYTNLKPNTLYVFPDPYLQGNTTGNTGELREYPLIHKETNKQLLHNINANYQYGDTKSNPLLATFRGYQAREQSLNYPVQGVSKYIDPQEFFTQTTKDIWANTDVYPLVPANRFPIDERTSKLISINKTLVQYKNDIFGNSYGLYKALPQTFRDLNYNQKILEANYLNKKQCLILNGHVFNDPVSGYNFNYKNYEPLKGYSGVVFRTVNNIPPGSGYFVRNDLLTPSTLSATNYNNGIPFFALSTIPFNIVSYLMQPENFCSQYVENTISCVIKDGYSFTSPTSGFLLQDFPSDSPDFNDRTPVYYDELADGGVNMLSPNFVPNFIFPARFFDRAPLSATKDYSCSYYIVSSFTDSYQPCSDDFIELPELTLENTFVNLRIPNRNTLYQSSLTSLNDRLNIYDTRNSEYGEFFYRNIDSSIILPVSAALSSVFIKYPNYIIEEINNKVVNFDIYYDILQIETENYLIFEKIEFNYENNQIKSSSTRETAVFKGNTKNFNSISNVWFNEQNNELIFAQISLYNANSATNFKIPYPIIYTIDLATLSFIQRYPYKDLAELNRNDLIEFSLSGTGENIEIVKLEKPVMSYNPETNTYNITYLYKDTSDLLYITNTNFKYFNNKLTNIKNSMYKPHIITNHNNFSNDINFVNLSSFSTVGNTGVVQNGTYTFGAQ